MRDRLVGPVEAECRDLEPPEVNEPRTDQDGLRVRISGVVAGRKSLSHGKRGRLKLEYANFQGQ